MLVSILQCVFFLAFGLTLFSLPFCALIAQVAALILGIIYLIGLIKSNT
jgi:hypothetical protein